MCVYIYIYTYRYSEALLGRPFRGMIKVYIVAVHGSRDQPQHAITLMIGTPKRYSYGGYYKSCMTLSILYLGNYGTIV